MRELLTREELLKTYGEVKPVRYLVTSAIDFKEIVNTTNLILAKAGSMAEFEALQQMAVFTVIPLPNCRDRFIACFEIPASLLGENRNWESQRLDFSGFSLPENRFRFEGNGHSAKFRCETRSLLDVNIALTHFDHSLAPIINNSSRVALRQSVVLNICPAPGDKAGAIIELMLPDLTSEQLQALMKTFADDTDKQGVGAENVPAVAEGATPPASAQEAPSLSSGL